MFIENKAPEERNMHGMALPQKSESLSLIHTGLQPGGQRT